ncbi:hypothetical protein V9T40_002211 [Parthenolecanium corni]|uniref:Solute carrier family 12 member 9 n=1 Tax=Parthenolecanium corni TaxID=536013 RepID=A0AAN9Y5D5_9HEMI
MPGSASIQQDGSAPVVIIETDVEQLIPSKKSFVDFFKWFSSKTQKREVTREGYTEFGSLNETPSGRTLSTFSGVFSPVALSMFSALLFLRVGFVVGNSGLYQTLTQFLIAYGIIFFTVSSVCAVSTNGEVEGGGAYFMISRTLGPEFGGSIGTLFFFANIVSSALYTVGFAEGLVNNFGKSGYLVGKGNSLIPSGPTWSFVYASGLNLLNFLICLVGAELFAKTTVFIFIIVTVSILSSFYSFLFMGHMEVTIPDTNNWVLNKTYEKGIYTGLNWTTFQNNLSSDYKRDYTSNDMLVSFSIVFGVLFSGVTGIMAGANMSGELKNPARSIPRGTISAVIFTMTTYVLLSILTAATCDRFLLQNDYLYLMPINFWPPFIAVGMLTATFSASLSTLIGSSRVIEALARDNIYGNILNIVIRGTWKSNPIAAVTISWACVQLMLLIGSLNTIAQINSILFLLAYFALNLACLGLELASAPNFRPSFKWFTWHTAAIGLVGSCVMMFVINPFYASSSIGLCLFIIVLLHFFSPARSASWGSISQALIFHQVRKYLLLLDSRKDHVKFWRPQMLLMVSNPRASCPLIDFVNDLKKSGLFVLGHVKVIPDFMNLAFDPVTEEYNDWLSLVDMLKVKAFVEITVANSVREGLQHLIRISGMGAMKPNTVVFGFYDKALPSDFLSTSGFTNDGVTDGKFPLRKMNREKAVTEVEYIHMISDVLKMRKNVCLCRNFQALEKETITKNNKFKYVDVWAMNFFNPSLDDAFDTTSLFMLQLSCIITMVRKWNHLRVRIFLCDGSNFVDDENASANFAKFKTLLSSLRILATVNRVRHWPSNIPSGFNFCNETVPENIKSYFKKVNELIRAECNNTAITFMYLPAPMSIENSDYCKKNYLYCLSEITNNLPPTVLVHGISAVTSTTL